MQIARNEADTRAQLVEPKLTIAGWRGKEILREFYYTREYVYTDGQITLMGDKVKRGKPKRVDYLLRYSESLPIAVVEVKPEDSPAEAGLEQAKAYARDLGLFFAYATNGREIVEYDFFTHTSRTLYEFPSPQALWQRWAEGMGLVQPGSPELTDILSQPATNPLWHPYYLDPSRPKPPRYYQERAIREVLLRIMRGQKRILLTMATGTGKTFVALQIVWKLLKSGWLKRHHPDRPARVLFLADRVVLRDQAYNTFSPFCTATSDPRYLLEGHPPKLTHDIYFAIYQSLWSPDSSGKRLFEKFPPDFFDLIIIDECHRSGWGTWREILDRFGSAVHLGMTATPKQDENVDTYAYFCAGEPEAPIDPQHPEKGTWHPPAFQYSLGQGIEDGFLATYKVYRVRTTIDASGLRLEDALEQGAEVIIPAEVEPRESYTTEQFEREITLPDRTKAMVDYLASLLRRFGHMEKTMVFCASMEHARTVARLLQDTFGPQTGLDEYAVSILSDEGEEALRRLRDFSDSTKKAPVVATTAELLSTGVDVPDCRNIVFMKTLSSPILFKQIIGRGSRLDPTTEKYWFRIIDFTGATRLFDEWDRPAFCVEPPQGPFVAALEGVVLNEETGEPIPGASVSVRTGPNTQQGPIRTDSQGRFTFTGLPEGTLTLLVSASGFIGRRLRVDTSATQPASAKVHLKPEKEPPRKILVKGLEVTIADEAIFTVDANGRQFTLQQYRDYTRQAVQAHTPTLADLRRVWVHDSERKDFLKALENAGIYLEALAEVEKKTDYDGYDILAHLVFGGPSYTRSERATAFLNREQAFLHSYSEKAREVILELLEKYRLAGIEQLGPKIFNVSPFKSWGGMVKISRERFGSVEELRRALQELRERLYPPLDSAALPPIP